jgi:outer membrane protein assembly factor BamE (lipoprotein component of BamABCDE complex)
MTPSRIVVALALVAVLIPGCLISSSSRTERSGRFVSDETLGQIRPGSKPDLVQALLGEPTSRVSLEDDQELWKWEYREEKTSRGGVFLLVSGRSTKETTGAVYVLMKGGVVERTWRD